MQQEWSLKNFNAGHISSKGRFMVKLPNHLRAYKSGWMLRSIAAYETYHGIAVKKTDRIHHINGNKLDDSKENLQLLTDSQHQKTHFRQRGVYIKCVCEHCGKTFEILRHRFNDKSRWKRGKFCSQKCFHTHKRTDSHKNNISKGLKRAYREGRR